jgi:4-amino-4-deoxy-L-arabinose transferase-like glycosyltransferase
MISSSPVRFITPSYDLSTAEFRTFSKGQEPSPGNLRSDRTTLAIAGLLALAYRFAMISLSPEADADAMGHWVVAQELSLHPGNIAANWLWLPGWHYVLVGCQALGITLSAVRVANALVQTAGPFVLYEMARRTAPRRTALLAALAWTAAALANRLAVSAESETCFTLLMVVASWALGAKCTIRSSIAAGVSIALACLTRYEAWGAVAFLTILVAPRAAERAIRWPAIVLPLGAIALWVWARSKADGAWFAFLFEIRAFAAAVDDATGTRGAVRELAGPIWYALVVPAKAFGPALLLVAAGLRRWWRGANREELAIAAGLFTFVWGSFVLHGSLGIDRHFTSIVPFACCALAHGIAGVENAVRSPAARRLVLPLTFIALIATTLAHGRWLLAREPQRRESSPGPGLQSPFPVGQEDAEPRRVIVRLGHGHRTV